jgi:hypothetical protein
MKGIIPIVVLVFCFSPLFGDNISGGFGGFEFGGISYNPEELNERFKGAGIEEISGLVYTWGGRGYGVISNVVIGGSGRGGHIKTVSDSVTIKIDIGYGLFEVGYLFPMGRRLALSPLLGIGGRDITLYTRPDLGDTDFDMLLIPGGAGRTSKASTDGTILSLSLLGLFRLGDFINIFARMGYVYDFGGDWELEDGAMLKNNPDLRLGGASFSGGVMFGFLE